MDGGSDRYGNRGASSNYGDRHGDRQSGGFAQRSSDRHGDRSYDNINNISSSSSSTNGPSKQPTIAASSYYAGSKFLSPPIPSALPMPPKSWLRDRPKIAMKKAPK